MPFRYSSDILVLFVNLIVVVSLTTPKRTEAAARMTTIDVVMFGARCDGVADDSAALRAAANAVTTAGAELRFPRATCMISQTIYLKSHTHVHGYGTTLLATAQWSPDHEHGFAMLENMHYAPEVMIDTDISISGITFDYGQFGQVTVPAGGKHAVRFSFASNILVIGNVFQMRGAEDAVAGIGVIGMRVQGNKAYEFRNCAYDFWFGSSHVQLMNNYGETTQSAQIVNFNPERTAGDSSGMVAEDFVMKGNILAVTGLVAVPIQIEPLGPHTKVKDVSVTGNKLFNVFLVMRGDVSRADIRDNTFDHVAGGESAFESYPWHGATAKEIVFAHNKIIDPQTKKSNVAVLRMEAEGSSVIGNIISGRDFDALVLQHNDPKGNNRGNTVVGRQL